jgi:hypothetical protein
MIACGGGAVSMKLTGSLPKGVRSTVPLGQNLSEQSVTLTGTPSEAGSFNFDVTASNGMDDVTLGGTPTVVALPVAPVVKVAKVSKRRNWWPMIAGSCDGLLAVAVVVILVVVWSRRRKKENLKDNVCSGALSESFLVADTTMITVDDTIGASDHPCDFTGDLVASVPVPPSSGAFTHRQPARSAFSYHPSEFASDLSVLPLATPTRPASTRSASGPSPPP